MIDRVAAYAAREFLPERALIEREDVSTGSMGEARSVWVVSAVDVPCRIIRGGETRRDMTSTDGAVEALPETYRLALSRGTAVGVNHRLTVGGNVYQVVGVEAMLTEQVFRMVTVVRR